MEPMIRVRAFIGTEEVEQLKTSEKLNNRLLYFMKSVTDSNGNTGNFQLIKETCGRNDMTLYFLEAEIPSWSEALFFVSYPEYRWDILEEP